MINSQNNEPIKPTSPEVAQPLKPTPAMVKSLLNDIFVKIYSNKLLFWTVSIPLGLIILIVILGLLFGNKNKTVTPTLIPTSSPIVKPLPESTPGTDILSISQIKLLQLKSDMEKLDVRQGRLQPPTVLYDVKF